MKFVWKYRYVDEGQMEPDRHNRWAINGYLVDGDDLILIAVIHQKDCLPDNCPSLVDRFSVQIPNADDMHNVGIGNRYYFANDIEKLKKTVETKYEILKEVLNRVAI